MTSLLDASEQALSALLYEKDANAPLDWCHAKVVANLKQAVEAAKKAKPAGEADMRIYQAIADNYNCQQTAEASKPKELK